MKNNLIAKKSIFFFSFMHFTSKLTRNEKFILLLSFAIAVLWFACHSIGVNYDTLSYLDSARHLLRLNSQISNPVIYMRTIGYPLLLLAAGYPLFKSCMVILFYQFLMAVLIPLIFYRSIFYIMRDEKIALTSACLCMVTMIPYVQAHSINTEQFFIFALFYMVYRLVLYYNENTARNLKFLMATLIILPLIRPSANMFFFTMHALFHALFKKTL